MKWHFKLTFLKHKTGAVPLATLRYIAWRNLLHKKLRAFLTIFGVTIGIGAIYFLLSFGIGLQRLVTSKVIGSDSVKSIQIESANSKILKLDESILVKVRNLPHVVRVGSAYSYAGSLAVRGSEIDTIVYGVDQNYMDLSSLSVTKGKPFNKDANNEVVVNQAALLAMGFAENDNPIGKQIDIVVPLGAASTRAKEIKNTFTIVGVISSGTGSEIFLPKQLFQTAGVSVYTDLRVEAQNNANVDSLRSQIESLGFETSSPLDTIDQINAIFKFFNVVLAGFGAIGMIVAVLGMFNTLTISLLERTREIGLMVALGARSTDMRKLFIIEALLLSVVGAVAGIILAFVLGQVVNAVMNQLAAGRGVTERFALFANPPQLVFGMIIFMMLVGLFVAYLPARRASRINPIDALRRE